ncbi:MAG: glycosyltransferase family 4 protein [Ignavibacteria bacterium]|nr:glycosyltransferase family 4 protein [Ignavibacteria bacterium]
MTSGDSRQLAELILKLAHDEDLRAKLGRQARQDVISHCTWDANVERILQSFQTPN